MIEKNEPIGYIDQEEILRTWNNSYTAVSKLWEDSYVKLYEPLAESTEEIFEKAIDLTKEPAPQKYKEFYEEWMKTYTNTFGKMLPFPELNKETLEGLISSSKETNKLFRSWVSLLEQNSKKTQELLQGERDPEKYKECYDMWMGSYEKIFDELLELPSMESTKKIFENYTGIPDTYSGSFAQVTKLWKNCYARLYGPWVESMIKLSAKTEELSRGEATPEAYKEFYNAWMDTFQDISGRYFQSKNPSVEVFESFVESTNIYLNMYRSWITALEKMAEKANELSNQNADPETYKEFYNLWLKLYEKAFTSFIDEMPVFGPVKDMMEPVKSAANTYSETFARMAGIWTKWDFNTPNKV